MAAWSTSWPARRVSLPTQRPWTTSRLWSSTIRKSRALGLPGRLRMGHPGTDQDVGDPALVGLGRLVAPEGPLVPEQLGPGQPALVELLAEGAFGDASPMTGGQDLGDVGGGAGRLLQSELDRLLDQFGMSADAALVGTRPVTQPGQALVPVGPDPAVQRVPADGVRLTVGAHVLLAGDAADDQPALPAPDPAVERLRDQVVAPQRELLGEVRGHSAPPAWTSPTSKPALGPLPRAGWCWSPAATRR